VIPGHRILTNAHVVSDSTFIQVRRYGESERVPARVLYVSDEADLALLTVDQPGFDAIPPLDLGGLRAATGDPGARLPRGGGHAERDPRRGVAHREPAVRPRRRRAARRTDRQRGQPGQQRGARARGRQGGRRRDAGVEDADKIAYMVPTPVVEHFLADVATGATMACPRPPSDGSG
jgi:hypothetical protein